MPRKCGRVWFAGLVFVPTPGKATTLLSLTKNGAPAATPLQPLISKELGCSGSVADGFDPLHALISKE
jgi:hypothetical protein